MAKLAQEPHLSRLIKFRNQYGSELLAFQDHVAGLAAELEKIATVENPAVAQAHLQTLYEKTTKRQLDDLRHALRGLGIESIAGPLALKVDLSTASSTVLGGVALAAGNALLGGAAVAMAIVPYIASKFKARYQQRLTSQVSYLLAANRSLNDRALRARSPEQQNAATLPSFDCM